MCSPLARSWVLITASAVKNGFGGRRAPTIILAVLTAFKIAALFTFAWNRRIVMDEFVQFGWAKYIPDKIGWLATWQAKAQAYALFFYPAHLLGWSARSLLLLGRMEMAVLACGTLALVYATARTLGQSRTRAALIVLVLLSFSNFIERIFETRGDPLSVFFAAAALLVAVRGRDRRWPVFAAGVLGGLAFVSTQKAVYFDFALGVALVADAGLERRFAEGLARGALLVLGWAVPIVAYCFAFGGTHPLPVARALFFGPSAVMSSSIPAEYGGLRGYVVQTLARNALLYLFCFAGMALALARLPRLDAGARIALIFSLIVTALVFAHNQPWPYVFIMALPFMALWALRPFDALGAASPARAGLWAVLAVAVAVSFAANVRVLRIDNHAQLALVDRAESLLGPKDVYFDGVGMLPDRAEPSTLWLDRHAILDTLQKDNKSEAYRIFSESPPKLIIWNYRIDSILPVILPLVRDSYVKVAPNIRMAGVLLRRGSPATFDAPVAGRYALYDGTGSPVQGAVEVNGAKRSPLDLQRGRVTVTLRSGPPRALLLLQGSYAGKFAAGGDDKTLFDRVYD